MMLEAFRLKQLLLFAVLALLSYIVYERYYQSDSVRSFEPFTKGYSLEGVVIKSTDESGQVVTTVESPLVIHYADSETTVIEQPRVRLHQDGGDWLFTSSAGELNADQSQIYFPAQVLLKLMGGPAQAVDIATSGLTVDVIDKTGTTAQAINVNKIGMLLQGLGAVVDFKQQEINILDEMYAEFEN